MKKTIKLTESKLIELIGNIVAEQQSGNMIPKPTTNKFLPPSMSNEPELTKPEPGPENYEEAKELNAFNEKILDLKNRGLMSPEQFMLQYNMKNGSRPIKTPNDKIIPYVTTDKFIPPAMSKEPEVTKPEPEELDSLQESINKIVKRFKKTISEQADQKRIAFFDNLAKQISTKIVGKKYFFGKIGVLDNTSIIVKRYEDRNQAINVPGYPVKEFNLYFLVRRVEEDLNAGEKPGTRVWTGLLSITAKFVNGKLSPNPLVELYPDFQGKTDFSSKIIPAKPWTWDMIGGAAIWANATTIEKKPIQGVPEPTNMQGGLRQVK